MMKDFIKNAAHYGDIVAIPLFLTMFIYFLMMENKTYFEWFLTFCMLITCILDIVFTLQFFKKI